MSSCYINANEYIETDACSILREDQYFDTEVSFCRVYSEETLMYLERILLRGGISYCIQEENTSLLSRLFSMRRSGCIVRINQRHMEKAMYLTRNLRGLEILSVVPEEDWSPRRAKERRTEEKEQRQRFYDARESARERQQAEEYYEEERRSRQMA